MADNSVHHLKNDPRLKIAVVGRTNCGKTSFLRTLVRRHVGEVADRAYVTQAAGAYVWEENAVEAMGIVLIDSPGFEEAGRLLGHLEAANHPGIPRAVRQQMAEEALEKFPLERQVILALEHADLILYLCSLETVPESSHSAEMEVVLKHCANLVGIVNMRRKAERAFANDKDAVANRVGLWASFYSGFNVPWVEYDSFSSSPAELTALLETSGKLLGVTHRQQLKSFAQQRQELVSTQRVAIVSAFMSEYILLRDTKVEKIYKKRNYSETTAKAEVERELSSSCELRLSRFIEEVAKIFGYSVERLQKFVAETVTLDQRVENYAREKASEIGALFGGVSGGLVGVAAAAVIFPPLAIPFLIGGAALGAGTGASVAESAVGDSGDQIIIETTPTEPILDRFAFAALLWSAAVAYHGFGEKSIVDEDAKALELKVSAAIAQAGKMPHSSDNEDDSQRWVRSVLRKIGV